MGTQLRNCTGASQVPAVAGRPCSCRRCCCCVSRCGGLCFSFGCVLLVQVRYPLRRSPWTTWALQQRLISEQCSMLLFFIVLVFIGSLFWQCAVVDLRLWIFGCIGIVEALLAPCTESRTKQMLVYAKNSSHWSPGKTWAL